MKDAENFKESLAGKKIPILVLDQKWHRLFAIHGKTAEVRTFEQEVNLLMARQGKLNTELNDMKKLKMTLMHNIVQNMDGASEDSQDLMLVQKLEADKVLINELNGKIEAAEDELLDIPNLIKDKNLELMIATMEFCYDKLRDNQENANEIAAWIKEIRIELKKKIIRKQNCEINNKEMYSYMHDIFGAQVIDIFDVEFDSDKEQVEEKKE